MTPEEIQAWLDRIGKDRAWLASQIGAKLGTLYNWFSKGFPAWAIKSITLLANPPVDKSAGLEVVFTTREFDRILAGKAISGHETLAAFYEDAILDYTDRLIAQENDPQKKIVDYPEERVAEQPPKLG